MEILIDFGDGFIVGLTTLPIHICGVDDLAQATPVPSHSRNATLGRVEHFGPRCREL
jgi:hypothetical protein